MVIQVHGQSGIDDTAQEISIDRSKVIKQGTLVTKYINSEILRDNRIGIDLKRSISVYLPPGYHESRKAYPVIYFFHSLGGSNERMFTVDNLVQPLLDRAIGNGIIDEFILVAANYSSPTLGSWFENSATSGRWLDYTIKEVVPFVDNNFRTIRHRDSRGLAGEFIGGYGALKFAMLYPELFSVVYALHPVGTGSGLMPPQGVVDWRRLHKSKSFAELWGDHYAPGFVAMSQAYLPNPNRPPFYCDFFVELENGEPQLQPDNLKKLQSRFHLDELLDEYAGNLRKMRGIAFDWGRYDQTQSHIYSNQAFTRKLDHLGIEHVAEEYNGGAYDKNWISHGRVEDNMLPFFNQHLVFREQ
ncbi:alpha/beta hydrolase-fold protein [Chryseolinea sp. H1M3-3]|uniref:alpha/beta hydrolase-fold protein n=1 Tax=Chryseolinea sp. H1M3-3 TaxID=3034144 RepID=UPI0023EE11AF|nr:alpha/beta hydrolase-fold protein [Chryseolinea sp. H1M3-3]